MSSTKPFDLIHEVNEMRSWTEHFILWPRQWRKYKRSHVWQNEKLETARAAQIPDRSGIYTLVLQPGIARHPSCSYLMYVGKTTSLKTRFRKYLGMERRANGRPRMSYFLNKYNMYICFCYTFVTRKRLGDTEDRLMKAYLPPLNGQYRGTISSARRAFS